MATQDYLAIGSAALNTSTGTQDLTISGLGWTPTGAIFFLSHATTNRAHADGATTTIAFADNSGGSKRLSFYSEHGIATSDTGREHDTTDGELLLHNQNPSGANQFVATIDSDDASAGPISNGWRINITDVTGGSAYIVKYVLIGNGASCATGTFATSSSPITETPGIQADLGFFTNANRTIVGTSAASNITVSFGCHAYDGSTVTQAGFHLWDDDASGTTDAATRLDSTESILHGTASGIGWGASVETITSTSFDVRRSTGTDTGRRVNYLVVELPTGVEADVSVVDTPTSTGSDWTISGVGFQPDFAMLVGGAVTAIDTTDATSAGVFNVSGYDGTTAFSIAHYTEDNQATSDTSSYVSDEWIDVYDDDGSTQDIRLNPTSSPFNSDGWTVANADITTADSTARKWIAISVGESSSGTNISATSDALTLTEYAASINAATNIAATVDNLTVTEYAASISTAKNVQATVDNLTLTEYAANINAATLIQATVDNLTITEYQATVQAGNNTTISINTDALTLTEYQANVNAATNISASVDALTVTEYQASVSTGTVISATLDALTLTEYNASINAETSISATTDALTLTTYQASVSNESSIEAAISGTITPQVTQVELREGGRELIITLTGDTWVAAGIAFENERSGIISGLTSAQSELTGWNNIIRDNLDDAAVVRTSDTVVTVTISDDYDIDLSSYLITADETITVTVPASALVTSSTALVPGTFDIAFQAVEETAVYSGGWDVYSRMKSEEEKRRERVEMGIIEDLPEPQQEAVKKAARTKNKAVAKQVLNQEINRLQGDMEALDAEIQRELLNQRTNELIDAYQDELKQILDEISQEQQALFEFNQRNRNAVAVLMMMN